MSFALVVPVHNDAEALSRLLTQAAALNVFDQLVLCDDGSDQPLRPELVPQALRPRLTLLRNDTPHGAGAARNRALQAVTTSHLLFFDADDLLTREISALWRSLAEKDFDFCLFRHNDSRVSRAGGWGQMAWDDALWRQAGMGGRSLHALPDDARTILAETANYPWNKICRTDFLRGHRIGCAEIAMHEDVELHWLKFLHAGTVLASDRICATHFVHPTGQRLSNRRDAVRLEAFASFSKVAALIHAAQGDGGPLLRAFLRFISGLVLWMRAHLDTETHDLLDRAVADFFRQHLSSHTFTGMVTQDPALALRMLFQMSTGHPQLDRVLAPLLAPPRAHDRAGPQSGLAPLKPAYMPPDSDTVLALYQQGTAA